LNGLLTGGIIGGLLAIAFLLGKQYYRKFKSFFLKHNKIHNGIDQ
jgi:uncharacterized membrane protein YdjX (TVP38/TMEM64 family)